MWKRLMDEMSTLINNLLNNKEEPSADSQALGEIIILKQGLEDKPEVAQQIMEEDIKDLGVKNAPTLRDVLLAEEGWHTDFKVPLSKTSKSGPTVGMGFDLGQKSFNEVKDLMGIDFARKYRPLIGLKGEEAQRYLDKNPMQVSEEEAQKMSDIVINDEIKKAGKLIRRLEKKRGKPFSETQKTALINMSYQLGENVDSEFPTAFKALVEGDIERARQEFMYTKAGSGKHSKWRKQTPNRALRVVESLLQDRPVWEVEQELVEAGLIDPKETAYDKFRNVT